ncbi:MAG: response regulator, partial [Defluviitaleaceae bacterium]|nr:response regulator [Defluviitaleaceae bacterium]
KRPVFEGEILICEDNDMNQQVVCEYLSKMGLRTVVAENGKLGFEIVRSRKQKNEKQFDLIFMDVHMPVMSGIEAAEKIFSLDEKIPIVAMTANIMPADIEIYKQIGMRDCIGKPFTSQELIDCLMDYFSPVGWKTYNSSQDEQTDDELRTKLIGKFVEKYTNVFSELTKAIDSGDTKLARRIMHTLKSNAGQLKKTALQQAAAEIENCLKDEKSNVNSRQMENFETELTKVLEEFSPLVREFSTVSEEKKTLDDCGAKSLLQKTASLLADNDPDCLLLVDELRLIPGSEKMIRQMENYDFKLALASCVELTKSAAQDGNSQM